MKVLTALLLISIIFYIPVIPLKNIVTIVDVTNSSFSNKTFHSLTVRYSLVLSDLGKSKFGKLLPILMTLVRVILVTLVLPVISTLTAIQFKRRYGNRDRKKQVPKTKQGNQINIVYLNVY